MEGERKGEGRKGVAPERRTLEREAQGDREYTTPARRRALDETSAPGQPAAPPQAPEKDPSRQD